MTFVKSNPLQLWKEGASYFEDIRYVVSVSNCYGWNCDSLFEARKLLIGLKYWIIVKWWKSCPSSTSFGRNGTFYKLGMLRKKLKNTNEWIQKKCGGHGLSRGHGLRLLQRKYTSTICCSKEMCIWWHICFVES